MPHALLPGLGNALTLFVTTQMGRCMQTAGCLISPGAVSVAHSWRHQITGEN